MKKFYEKADMNVVNFDVDDIISTSDPNMGNPDDWGNDHDIVDEE